MISDEGRRDIAARLREAAAHPDPDGDVYCGCLVDCGLLQRGTYSGHATPESVEFLADLVDRPTCHNVADPCDGSLFECSNCGEAWEMTCGSPADNNLCFCPRCGAGVVHDA